MGWMITGVLMGIGGTLAMDLWALLLRQVAGLPLPNWGNVGRWSVQVTKGQVFNDDIGAISPVAGETGIGWAVHYGVGIFYGVLFLVIVGPGWPDRCGISAALGVLDPDHCRWLVSAATGHGTWLGSKQDRRPVARTSHGPCRTHRFCAGHVGRGFGGRRDGLRRGCTEAAPKNTRPDYTPLTSQIS